jgi:hypothetical protein
MARLSLYPDATEIIFIVSRAFAPDRNHAASGGKPLARRDDAENVGRTMHDSYPREIRLESRQAFEIVRGGEQVDVWQRRLHAARLRAVVAPADQGIEPDDAPATATQAAHFLAEHFG